MKDIKPSQRHHHLRYHCCCHHAPHDHPQPQTHIQKQPEPHVQQQPSASSTEEVEIESRGRQPSTNSPKVEIDSHNSELWLDGTMTTQNQTRSASSSRSSSRNSAFSTYPDRSHPDSLSISDIDNIDYLGYHSVGYNSPNLEHLPGYFKLRDDGSYCVIELPPSKSRPHTAVRRIGRERKAFLEDCPWRQTKECRCGHLDMVEGKCQDDGWVVV
jgi:hypothetical protein